MSFREGLEIYLIPTSAPPDPTPFLVFENLARSVLGAAHNRYTGGGEGIGSVRAAKKVVAVYLPPLGPVSLSPESSSCLGGSLHTADPWRGVIVLNFRRSHS